MGDIRSTTKYNCREIKKIIIRKCTVLSSFIKFVKTGRDFIKRMNNSRFCNCHVIMHNVDFTTVILPKCFINCVSIFIFVIKLKMHSHFY